MLWTGVSVSTAAKLHKLFEKPPRGSRSILSELATAMADTWCAGDADAVLEVYRQIYINALRQFSVDHDLGIFDAGHDQLTDAAMVDGLVYKPAGAGGGDVGMLFGRDEADLDAFLERRSDLVRGVLPCALDESGVRMEAR
mgnify:CR=1 FL=1